MTRSDVPRAVGHEWPLPDYLAWPFAQHPPATHVCECVFCSYARNQLKRDPEDLPPVATVTISEI